MSIAEIKITAAAPAQLDEILSLLTVVGLPHEGVSEYLDDFLVAVNLRGEIVGCAGLELYGPFGLLRSVAVSKAQQSANLGSRLTARLLERAQKKEIREVVLLTTTARDFFVRRFGFVEAARADYDAQFSDSPEWNLPRCASAVVMKLSL